MVQFPSGLTIQELSPLHRRQEFDCASNASERRVNEWLAKDALQSQKKKLSRTQVLVAADGKLAGFFTLAMGQIDFGLLPPNLAKRLPRRAVPVAVLAWLGVDKTFRKKRLGDLLLAQALSDCYRASQTFPLVAVILDCLNDSVKQFYQRWDFQELPGHPLKLYLSADALEAMMKDP